MSNPTRTFTATLILIFVSLWFRLLFISSGLPYFYEEDEAHHFNRVVEMVQQGRYNPEYFHKPSLHFYLRMPVVAASFLWSVRKGHIRSIQEIETRDPFGVGQYAFSTSHPGIVRANRLLTLLFGLALVVATVMLGYEVTGRLGWGILAGGIVSVSPDLIRDSAKIGVDTPMAALCLFSVLAAVKFVKTGQQSWWLTCTVLAGFAISTKYNAAPIALLPFSALWVGKKLTLAKLTSTFLLLVASFLGGSPFILAELPLFLDHLAYEIWHYGVAGHVGQMAEPGLSQLLHYGRWLAESGVGFGVVCFGLVGFVLLVIKSPTKTSLPLLIFPILFAALMSNQKTNFTRNMLVIIPFFALLAAYSLCLLEKQLADRKSIRVLSRLVPIIGTLLLVQPIIVALAERASVQDTPETRTVLAEWLSEVTGKQAEVALSGQLQMPVGARSLPGVSVVSEKKESLESLYASGFDYMAASSSFAGEMAAERTFEGSGAPDRIVKNPTIHIFNLKDLYSAKKTATPSQEIRFNISKGPANGSSGLAISANCAELEKEGDLQLCWATQRRVRLTISSSLSNIKEWTLEAMTPWDGQLLTLLEGDQASTFEFDSQIVGKWIQVLDSSLIDRTECQEQEGCSFETIIGEIHSPLNLGLSPDSRRLGVAFRVRSS